MIIYRRFIPPPALIGSMLDAAGFALHMPHGSRHEEKWRHESELGGWEEEGGSLAAPASAPQSS